MVLAARIQSRLTASMPAHTTARRGVAGLILAYRELVITPVAA
jgi:hypothetical protein